MTSATGEPSVFSAEPAPREPEVLDAYREDDGRLWAWCEHEGTWHQHGAGPECGTYCNNECATCFGNGDGHRGEHCRCPKSPHAGIGYVLREVGPLSYDVLQAHDVISYIRGCRPDSCRLDRAQRAAQLRAPGQLPDPKSPLLVAQSVAVANTAIDYSEMPADYEARLRSLWSGVDEATGRPNGWPSREMPPVEYDVAVHGPLTLRRWRDSWMRWAGTHWAELEDAELRKELYQLLGNASYVKHVPDKPPVHIPWNPNRSSVGEVVAALEGLAHLPGDVTAPAWLGPPGWASRQPTNLVACTNGLLDVESRTLGDHDPDWFNLVSVPFAYDPWAEPPVRWLAFLAKLWPEDPQAIDALQEWFGYVISGRTDLQKMLLLVGPPRSGKGTIVRILTELVGKGNHAGPTLASLATNFGLQPLVGKSLAVVADARLGGKDTHVVVERLLTISGEDSITIDRKYREPWTGRLPSRLMVLSNELPHFGDASGAIATRFIALQVTQSWLGREDTTLGRALAAELPGILRWALDGLQRLTEVGRFTEPASSADSLLTMIDSASPTGAFVREQCQVGPGLAVPAKQLFAAWRGWCYENGRDHPGNEQTFGRTLRSVVPTLRVSRPRDPATGQQVRVYQGIALSHDESRQSLLSAKVFSPPHYQAPIPHTYREHQAESSLTATQPPGDENRAGAQ